MQSSNSPQPAKRGTDSPASEQTPPNKDNSAPPPQQSPAAEQAEGAGEESETSPAEMTLDITSFRKPGEKTFTQRSRLFIGNLPLNMPEEEFKSMFAKYGNINEVFINRDRGFGFIRLVCIQSSAYWFNTVLLYRNVCFFLLFLSILLYASYVSRNFVAKRS